MSARFDNQRHFTQWNEEMARKYDPEAYHLRSNFPIRWIERRRVKAILHFLNASQQDAVLEVGCGAGNVLEQVSSNQLHGIDLSTFLIRKAQRRLAHRQAKLVQADAERLPFADGQFRALICTEVLEHVPDPRQIVSEMARVAIANAVLVISVPNETWINRVKGTVHALGLGRWLLQGSEDSYSSPDKMTDEWHLHSFDLTLLQETLENILLIRQIRAVPFAFIPLRYVVQCQVIGQETLIQ
jgi:2-polyprenyl-3-methyl-5-hydroxy-6-metoxy-1,4-benzoquinol methylase